MLGNFIQLGRSGRFDQGLKARQILEITDVGDSIPQAIAEVLAGTGHRIAFQIGDLLPGVADFGTGKEIAADKQNQATGEKQDQEYAKRLHVEIIRHRTTHSNESLH